MHFIGVVMMAKLTDKQQKFVDEYLIDLNATQAAIRSGYSVKNADKIGSELLGKTGVAEAVAKAKAVRSRRTGISADRVVLELARMAFVDPTNVVDFATAKIKDDISEDDRAALAGIKIKDTDKGTEREIKLADKLKALELLGKHLGVFDDRAQDGDGGVQIIDDV
jgi:phage terminase small subunit